MASDKTANNALKPPESFSFEPEKWEIWKSRFKRYLSVSGQSKKPDEFKIDLLIYYMGEQAESLKSRYSGRMEFDAVINAIDEHFYPKLKITRLRTMFDKRKQEEGESIENFISNLQAIADKCEFGTMKNDLIRYRILCGVRDFQLRNKLLARDGLTLEETICMIQEAEAGKNRSVVKVNADQKSNVSAISRQGTSNYCQVKQQNSSIIDPDIVTIDDEEEEVQIIELNDYKNNRHSGNMFNLVEKRMINNEQADVEKKSKEEEEVQIIELNDNKNQCYSGHMTNNAEKGMINDEQAQVEKKPNVQQVNTTQKSISSEGNSHNHPEKPSASNKKNRKRLRSSNTMPANILSGNRVTNVNNQGGTLTEHGHCENVFPSRKSNNCYSGNTSNVEKRMINDQQAEVKKKSVSQINTTQQSVPSVSKLQDHNYHKTFSANNKEISKSLHSKNNMPANISSENQERSSQNKAKEGETFRPTEQSRRADLFISEKSINDLGPDCLSMIFSYLSLPNRIRIERVCKIWKDISLESWIDVKTVHIRSDFKTRSIELSHLEAILRRCGDYVTKLDCRWLDKSKELSANDTMKLINKYCKKLTYLNTFYTFKTEKSYLNDLDLSILENLKSLNIGNYDCHDENLSTVITNCVNLEELNMIGYDYEGYELLNLSEKCKTLSVTYSKTFSNDMLQKLLENHPNVQNLDISGTDVTLPALLPFRDQFQSLSMWEMDKFFKIPTESIQMLKCPNLRVLDLRFNDSSLNGEILSILAENCPNAEDLRLEGCKVFDENDFKHLGKFKNLKELDVSGTNISDGSLILLSETALNLKKLDCSGCNYVTVTGLCKVIAAYPKLTYLVILSSKLSKPLIKSALASLLERKYDDPLTLYLVPNAGIKIPDLAKTLKLNDGFSFSRKANYLRIVYGLQNCVCNFIKTCFCTNGLETLAYFG